MMVKRKVVTRQRERNKGRLKDETNCSRKLEKVTFQNHCDSKNSKAPWNGSGFNKNLSAKFGSNYTGKAGCDKPFDQLACHSRGVKARMPSMPSGSSPWCGGEHRCGV